MTIMLHTRLNQISSAHPGEGTEVQMDQNRLPKCVLCVEFIEGNRK